MYTHQGSRLKNLIEKSGKKIYKIVEESHVSNASLYNYFKLEELEKKKIAPVLKAINVTWEEFTGGTNNEELEELRKQLKACNDEKEVLYKRVIDLMTEKLDKISK